MSGFDAALTARARPPEPLARIGPSGREARIDVDFSLAIHNRTGKYFIGRDILAVIGERLGSVYYGSVPFNAASTGLLGRALGRIQLWQVRGQAEGARWRIPRRPRRLRGRPLLHLDPFTVPTAKLRRGDAVICHDVGPLTHPELFDRRVGPIYRAIYREIAAVGPHLVFVSEASRAAFDALFPEAQPASVRVIYPALRGEMRAGGRAPAGLDVGPFLLCVGSLGARKNQARCIEAFARSGLATSGMRFVLCGGPEPGFERVRQAAEATRGVVLLPYVSDAELAWLFRHAVGFVLASLLEGFGIPVAEAIAAGLIPLVSRGGVLEEVAGPGALTADPLDPGAIAAGMRALCAMREDERRLRQAQLAAAVARFRPERFAREWERALAAIAAEAAKPAQVRAQ